MKRASRRAEALLAFHYITPAPADIAAADVSYEIQPFSID
jgi:hypothetical protein